MIRIAPSPVDVGLLAVLGDVHADRLLVLARPQRHRPAPISLQQHEGDDEGVGGRDQRRQRLVAELGGVAVEEAVGDAVPGGLGEEADEEDPEEAGDAVGGEHVERLVDPGPRAARRSSRSWAAPPSGAEQPSPSRG